MWKRYFSRAASGASLWWTCLVCIALVFGCGDVTGTSGDDGEMPGAHLETSPSDARAPIVTRSDAIGSVSFSVAHASYGVHGGLNHTVNGNAAGPTGVIASSPYPAC